MYATYRPIARFVVSIICSTVQRAIVKILQSSIL